MHLVPDVLVKVLRDPGRGVPELLGDDLDVNARLERKRRRSVPRHVEFDDRQPSGFREFAEPAGDVIRVQCLAELTQPRRRIGGQTK